MNIMASKQRPINTAICPICGKPNQCAVAADPSATECWCETVIFPEELLVMVPENAVRKTCICQSCLRDYQESVNKSGTSF
jgi:hypothetical protein